MLFREPAGYAREPNWQGFKKAEKFIDSPRRSSPQVHLAERNYTSSTCVARKGPIAPQIGLFFFTQTLPSPSTPLPRRLIICRMTIFGFSAVLNFLAELFLSVPFQVPSIARDPSPVIGIEFPFSRCYNRYTKRRCYFCRQRRGLRETSPKGTSGIIINRISG